MRMKGFALRDAHPHTHVAERLRGGPFALARRLGWGVADQAVSSMSDFEGPGDDGQDFDFLEAYQSPAEGELAQSAEDTVRRAQVLRDIEAEIQELPARQREAFLMRYWEEMDVAETAAAMGCSEGSVKTHCFRAVQTLSKALKAKGIVL